jgi:hypothetical protein
MSPRLMTTEVASRDGTKIALDASGDGPPLILIAGARSDRAQRGRLVEMLALGKLSSPDARSPRCCLARRQTGPEAPS